MLKNNCDKLFIFNAIENIIYSTWLESIFLNYYLDGNQKKSNQKKSCQETFLSSQL